MEILEKKIQIEENNVMCQIHLGNIKCLDSFLFHLEDCITKRFPTYITVSALNVSKSLRFTIVSAVFVFERVSNCFPVLES